MAKIRLLWRTHTGRVAVTREVPSMLRAHAIAAALREAGILITKEMPKRNNVRSRKLSLQVRSGSAPEKHTTDIRVLQKFITGRRHRDLT